MPSSSRAPADRLPITVIIPTRNERENLLPCLDSVACCQRVIVVDSGSNDGTADLARRWGAEVHLFDYKGGWPKKRQWALDQLEIRTPWTLLLDADERLTPGLRREFARIIHHDGPFDGYWLSLRLVFLGTVLRHGASGLRKLSFFRTGRARFECLIADQNREMADMEVHEHLLLDGREGQCRGHLLHENVHDLHRYIAKHNEYSTWSAELVRRQRSGTDADGPARRASPWGVQADRRRFLARLSWKVPLAGVFLPMGRFLWFYLFRLGFLDGRAGFYYCGLKAVQAFHIMAKVMEKEAPRRAQRSRRPRSRH